MYFETKVEATLGAGPKIRDILDKGFKIIVYILQLIINKLKLQIQALLLYCVHSPDLQISK